MINCTQVYLPMGVQHCYGKGEQLLLWAGSQATRRKITLSGIPNHLKYCVIFMAHTSFKIWPQATQYNLAGCGLETHVFTKYVWLTFDQSYTTQTNEMHNIIN